MQYNVNISSSVLHGQNFIHRLADPLKAEYTRKKSAMLGDVDASFTLYPEDGINLFDAFQTWLCNDVTERAAGRVAWTGLIGRMIHTSESGVQREISIEFVYNKVYVKYDDAGSEVPYNYAGPYENSRSQARYGVKEIIVDARENPSATRAVLGNSILADHAFPRVVVLGQGDRPEHNFDGTRSKAEQLQIFCLGYGVTLAWTHDDTITTSTASDTAITTLATGSYIQSGGKVETNSTAVTFSSMKRPKLHLLQETAHNGSSSYAKYWFKINADRKPVYAARETAPRYFLRKGVFYDSVGTKNAVNVRLIEPALVRDMDWTRLKPLVHSSEVSKTDVNTIQGNEFWLDEVGLSADGKLTWRVTEDPIAPVRHNYDY